VALGPQLYKLKRQPLLQIVFKHVFFPLFEVAGILWLCSPIPSGYNPAFEKFNQACAIHYNFASSIRNDIDND